MNNSGLGEDFLGTGPLDSVDPTLSDQSPVVLDGVESVAAEGRTRGSDAGPVDGEDLAVESAGTGVDSSGDNPLNGIGSVLGQGSDNEDPGVLDSSGADAVDRVGTGEPVLVSPVVSDQVTGQGGEVEHDEKGGDSNDPFEPLHTQQPSDALVIPRGLKVTAFFVAVLVIAAAAFAIFEPIQVLPRIRLAPGFAMVDANGDLLTSEDTRGELTIYSFAPVNCGEECASVEATLADVLARVDEETGIGNTPFRIVTIGLDSNGDPERLAEAQANSLADGEDWIWVGADQSTTEIVVGAGFGRYMDTSGDEIGFEQSLVLVDGWGVVRGDYKYQTLGSESDKLIHHLGILTDEIQYSHGANTVAYEAAHLFLCYP